MDKDNTAHNQNLFSSPGNNFHETRSNCETDNDIVNDCYNYDLGYLYQQVKSKKESEEAQERAINAEIWKNSSISDNIESDLLPVISSNDVLTNFLALSQRTGLESLEIPDCVANFEDECSEIATLEDQYRASSILGDADLCNIPVANMSHIKIEPDIQNIIVDLKEVNDDSIMDSVVTSVNPMQIYDDEVYKKGIIVKEEKVHEDDNVHLEPIMQNIVVDLNEIDNHNLMEPVVTNLNPLQINSDEIYKECIIKKEKAHMDQSFQVAQQIESSTGSVSDDSSLCSSSTENSPSEDEEIPGKSKTGIESFDNKGLKTQKTKGSQSKAPRLKGEILHCELPPIEDLHITVAEHECVLLGKITSIVEDLVVIKAMPDTPALDLDSVLFLDKGSRTLGKIFDVIGQVTSPSYCVRFNSLQHIKESNININIDVYCAPRTEHTSFVFVEQLKKIKGSDASWKDNLEPDSENIEFSDDEQEKAARKAKKQQIENKKLTGNNQEKQEEAFGNNSEMGHKIPRRVKKAGKVYRPAKPVQETINPFYRNTKRYNPRENGPIRWDTTSAYNEANIEAKKQQYITNTNDQSLSTSHVAAGNMQLKQSRLIAPSGNQNFLPWVDFSRPPPSIPGHISRATHATRSNWQVQGPCISKPPMKYSNTNTQEGHKFGQLQFDGNVYGNTSIVNSPYSQLIPAYQQTNSSNFDSSLNLNYIQHKLQSPQPNKFYPPLPAPQCKPPLPPPPPKIMNWYPIPNKRNEDYLMPPGT